MIKDIPISVTCKFETLIFKSAHVIKYNVMFAFLFVQTVYANVLISPQKELRSLSPSMFKCGKLI